MSIRCKLGFHKPTNIKEQGYCATAKCSRCKCNMVQDNHWAQGDGKWRKGTIEDISGVAVIL